MTDSGALTIQDVPRIGDVALCMGVFDGVHRGHLVLVEATLRAARDRGLAGVALVFDPHPDEVVRPGSHVRRLAPLHENLRRLGVAGIQPVAVSFDRALRALAAEDFLRAMAPAIRVRALVMSAGSAFGRDRAGTPEAMEILGRSAGFAVERVDALLTEADEPISSRRIRRVLAEGALEEANRLLGHPAYLEGVWSTRDGGRLAFGYHPALPSPGAYRASIRSAEGSSRTDGVRLTVDPDGTTRLGLDGPPQMEPVALDLIART